MLISHILYGTATLTHGGLLFTARDAGARGAQLKLSVVEGSPLAISVNLVGSGKFVSGKIEVTAPLGTTESQLLIALQASADFKALASAKQLTGNGSAIVGALAETPFVAEKGLTQFLSQKLGILEWSQRDLIATGAPVGLIWVANAKCIRPDEEEDIWSGTVQIGIAVQHDTDFVTQNALLDLVRRNLHKCIRTFTHEALSGFGPFEYAYGNETKDEKSGSKFDHARLRVIGTFGARWIETDTRETVPLSEILIGLFLEPLTDELGDPGAEEKDADIIVGDEEEEE